VSLATTDGRIEADYVLPNEDNDTPHSEYLFSDEYETTDAELHYRGGDWVLHIHCKRDGSPTCRNRQLLRTERFSGLTSA
jgi:hypothetical protein